MFNLKLSRIWFRVPQLEQLRPSMILQLFHISVCLQERFEHVEQNHLCLWYALAVEEDRTDDGFEYISEDLQRVLVERLDLEVPELLIAELLRASQDLRFFLLEHLLVRFNASLRQDALDDFTILVELPLKLVRVLIVKDVLVDASLD